MIQARQERPLIVISYYAQRSPKPLMSLLKELSGYASQTLIVANVENINELPILAGGFKVVANKNVGMNIGAWHRGFLEDSDADYYLFLQDECFLKKDKFLDLIIRRFKGNPRLGMVGESMNYKWGRSWLELTSSPLNTYASDHLIDGKSAKRVQAYLSAMFAWGIEPGESAAHLRSLVWAFPGAVMRRLGGFPLGMNKGECIAAEIAISRKVVSLGYIFDQITPTPFTYFGHREWRSDGSTKL
jgi:hypothetical protein